MNVSLCNEFFTSLEKHRRINEYNEMRVETNMTLRRLKVAPQHRTCCLISRLQDFISNDLKRWLDIEPPLIGIIHWHTPSSKSFWRSPNVLKLKNKLYLALSFRLQTEKLFYVWVKFISSQIHCFTTLLYYTKSCAKFLRSLPEPSIESWRKKCWQTSVYFY